MVVKKSYALDSRGLKVQVKIPNQQKIKHEKKHITQGTGQAQMSFQQKRGHIVPNGNYEKTYTCSIHFSFNVCDAPNRTST